jgi:hypothetical protein
MLKPTPDDIKEENRRMQELDRLVDRTALELKYGSHSYDSSRKLIEQTRRNALELFPDKGYLFDLIYRPRFYRILDENFITI